MRLPFTTFFLAMMASATLLVAQPLAPATQPAQLGLKYVKSLAIPPATVDELAKLYPQFKHAPFEESGTNALILPFRDESTNATTEDSLAFSFLLSWDMDWVPDNFCSRHAYFIFKRNEKACRYLSRRYEPRIITAMMAAWHSTHAIGGSIRKQADGYTGSLIVYAADGTTVATEKFDTPRTYHELLGDVSVAAMKALRYAPPAELIAHLHQPRCKNDSSIALLGQAAFDEERSDHEFGLYRKILEQDPGFAEVRFWLANQSYWETYDRSTMPQQMSMVLNSHIMPAAYTELNIHRTMPDELRTKMLAWVDQTAKIAGENHPLVLSLRLDLAEFDDKPNPELMARALKAAGKSPNNAHLLYAIANAAKFYTGDFDYELAISVALAVMQSRYIPGNDYSYAARIAAEQLLILGRVKEALQVLLTIEDPSVQNDAVTIEALTQACDFEGVRKWYYKTRKQTKTEPEILRNLAFCACVLDDTQMIQDLLAQYGVAYERARLAPILRGYLDELQDPAKVMPFDVTTVRRMQIQSLCPILLLYANRDIQAHDGKSRIQEGIFPSTLIPTHRLAWIMADLYLQKFPNPNATPFYEGLEFLYPNDPWVKDAVARRAAMKFPPMSEQPWESHPALKDQAAIAAIKDWSAEKFVKVLRPWGVTARVRALLAAGKNPEAVALARKYLDAARQTRYHVAVGFARQLLSQAESWDR